MVARFLRGIGLAGIDHRPHACIGRDHVTGDDFLFRELPMQRCQQVVEFLLRDCRFLLQICLVVHIRGADQGNALPGIGKDGTAILRMHQAHGLRQRQAP
jgi:hypothetical protein